MKRLLLAIALGGALSGCAATQPRARPMGIVEKPVSAWRDTIKLPDAAIVDAMPARWAAARARVGKAAARAITAQGVLLGGPALDHPAPSPGPYRCRLVRLGAGGVRSFPAATCFIGGDPGDMLSFTKATGSDAPGGWLYPDDVTTRYVFLGARQLRPGTASLAYGKDATRNLAGVVERIGTFRWRLVIPGAADTLDVYDLTPLTGAAPAK
ncbi:MAG: hypothetical protein JWL96_1488 [Sphingomonas bacterium]|uniref:DUF4893 domain-containing protein n=1 Tax=Sphingomonas bacterium TaxID=1895847 RepID=UPI0026205B85|nr:DUF4893 domain-containing protein [Sphingomonas bacterium]MDB5709418.1 hypothetical protein [Sphingomonas bacterium]